MTRSKTNYISECGEVRTEVISAFQRSLLRTYQSWVALSAIVGTAMRCTVLQRAVKCDVTVSDCLCDSWNIYEILIKIGETNVKQKRAKDSEADKTLGKRCQRNRRLVQLLAPMGSTRFITCGLIWNPAMSPVSKRSHLFGMSENGPRSNQRLLWLDHELQEAERLKLRALHMLSWWLSLFRRWALACSFWKSGILQN